MQDDEVMALKAELASANETIEVLSDSDAVRQIREGVEDIKAGRTVPPHNT